MMKSMGVPATFWAEAVRTAVHILNRSPSRSLKGVTPYEAWRGKKPRVDYFRTFGCMAHMKITGHDVTKLSDRARPVVFIGYEDGAKAYRVFDRVEKRLHITRDVVFEEERRWSWSGQAGKDAVEDRFTVVFSDETEVSVSRARSPEDAQCTPDLPAPPTPQSSYKPPEQDPPPSPAPAEV